MNHTHKTPIVGTQPPASCILIYRHVLIPDIDIASSNYKRDHSGIKIFIN